MNKEQAIKTLKKLLLNIAGEKDCEAIEFAIAALQSNREDIDWDQAPDGANYHTTDPDGQRFYHECEPINDDGYFLTSEGMVWNDYRKGSERIVRRPKHNDKGE
jgi:hypothetical protein